MTKSVTNPKPKTDKNPKGAGRPTILTKQVQAVILDAIDNGSFIQVACRAAGISKVSFFKWMERGEDDPESNFEASPLYRNFRNAVLQAEAKAEIKLLKQAQAPGNGAVPAMMVMSRRWRERWSETQKHEITGRDGGPIEMNDARQKLTDRITNLAGTIKAPAGDPVLN